MEFILYAEIPCIFSFILLIGFFLLIKSIIISVVSILLLLIIYPKTIKHEEDKLLKIHGQSYSIIY